MDKREEFLRIFDEKIKREGAAELRAYLTESDFFQAPASMRYHCAYAGGLCEHSINVYRRLLRHVEDEYGSDYQKIVPDESIAICGLLHDVCKVNFYRADFRNVKENGEWVRKPCFVREELFPFGHGEKSVFIVNRFLRLTGAEAMAINWHMGGFDSRAKGGDYSVSDAYCKYPLAVLLHISDLEATYIDEKRGF